MSATTEAPACSAFVRHSERCTNGHATTAPCAGGPAVTSWVPPCMDERRYFDERAAVVRYHRWGAAMQEGK